MPSGPTHLFIPGPTNVPEVVRRAVNVPMQDHRAPDFPELTGSIFEDLKTVFANSTGRVFVFAASGTGAWEAAITNTLRRGDRVLMARYGQFSHLWVEMATRLGLDVVCLDVPWGEGVPVDQYAEHLAADPGIRAVFVTHNETSTGVTSDVAAVRRAMDAAGSEALLFVDGVSSIASIDFEQDAWGVDLAVSGSQKGFMLPPGLAFLSVSLKALEANAAVDGTVDGTDRAMSPSYFSFASMATANDTGYFPQTPPTQLLHGLRASLDLLLDEGLPQVYARHYRLAEGVRRGVAALGLDLCATDPAQYSDTVSAIRVPHDVDSGDVVRIAYHRYRTSFGAGLSKLAGQVFRIGHLGDCNEVMCLAALAAAEISLNDAGAKIELGAGVAAAQAHYSQHYLEETR
ncbi:aminotransferase class V-fold PLP-dependent enzyme [Nocardioides agariphilus]|jgi:alanine-glyoxylate transaminase/serine-glyoxylate transaminase/serine-pyruvate transaminase|uniref:Tritium exchange subunit n=1 Tax=Nocardioides agariphilus TaxID=433664 RepID=A0A930VMK0_9ACTN|nr:aminotransferase class V-fold PLP-dependent enzyme [Nocardioides agariphilus]MBF4769427.1 aminotransferase class V-fold PLP-dependent enzyme [Nocardioides agariphilus]